MRKLKKEHDGSFGYAFTSDEIKEMILKKYPKLIDKNHKFDCVDLTSDNVAILIRKKKNGSKN
jgi:hypothetical protein